MIILFIFLTFLIIYTYLLYPALLVVVVFLNGRGEDKGKEWRIRERDKGREGGSLSVSMVVSAYNEEDAIKEKIENFLSLDYPKELLELLIGSDGSNDKTASIVEPFISERIRYFGFAARRGKASVLNDIVPQARGDIIVFSDADTIYEKDSLKKLVSHFQDGKAGGVCGRLVLRNAEDSIEEEGLYWRYENFIKEKESAVRTIVSMNGQIFAIRKALFEPVPGDSITEDQVIGMRIIGKGFDIHFEPDAICYEYAKPIWGEFTRRTRISAGNFQSISLSKKVLDPGKGFPSFALWSHKILRWFVPFFLLALFLINIFLLDSAFFKVFFSAQLIFYLNSFLYYVLSRAGFDNCLMRTIFYFNVMNIAILTGFIRYLKGSQKVTW